MSRIVVKGLPPRITKEELKNLFGNKGLITDIQLKYTKDGVFRHFAFIGFKKEEEAKAAKDYYDNTYVKSSKIKVEMCAPLGDSSKPRAWSRYAKDSSAYQKKAAKPEKETKQAKPVKQAKENTGKNKKPAKEKGKDENLLLELQSDPQFAEFVEIHKKKGEKPSWTDSTGENLMQRTSSKKNDDAKLKEVCFDDSASGSESGDEAEEEEETKDDESDGSKGSSVDLSKISKIISDADYLKSKVVKSIEEEEEGPSSEESSEESSKDEDAKEVLIKTKKKNIKQEEKSAESAEESNDSESDDNEEADSPKNVQKQSSKSSLVRDHAFTVKLRNLPYKCRKKEIKVFFRPLKIASLRLPPRVKGISYVKFKTEKDFRQALKKHRSILTGHQIEVVKYEPTAKSATDPTVMDEKTIKWKKNEEEIEKDETVAESGRLFVRNLPYTTTEEELEKHFSQYGPLAEVNLPIDKLTRIAKGFAFVTFVMPEHAVKAYTEEDGKIFQGRMLHILPGKSRKADDSELSDTTNFKQKKEAKQKKQSQISHNWNTLFLGADAVAESMAARYKTSKSHILSAETSQSIAVRMALGETQIVSETRKFLLDNGVSLDAFSQPASQRSKTVILVKNLPANTSPEDLNELFSKHGELGRIILPPQGITAIVEFLEPSEARSAFRKLAYTKFQHIPLYLEWAPVSTFTSGPATQKTTVKEEETEAEAEKHKSTELLDEEDDEPEAETTLFVKNVNFATTDEALKKHFEKCGRVYIASVSKKKDLRNPGQLLSMGYGFVQYKRRSSAVKALKDLQRSKLDGHSLELKTSNKVLETPDTAGRKKTNTSVPENSTKILVRNIPFQAKSGEIRDLFSTFGELKVVRLPRKLSEGEGSHRGFGFVDFLTKHDAKRAFNALCHSTHLYGRRLVLEWANPEETVEGLRRKTAHHFHEGPAPHKKRPKSSADVSGLLAAVDKHHKDEEDSS